MDCIENGTGTRRGAKVVTKTESNEGLLCPVIRDHVGVTNVPGSETSLPGDPSSRSVDASPGRELLDPRRRANV